MTTPEPVTAWAVYDDNGTLVDGTIEDTEYEAQRRMCLPDMTISESWNSWYKRGYRVRKVKIEVVK